MLMTKLMIPVVGALSFMLFACDPVQAQATKLGDKLPVKQSNSIEAVSLR